MTPLNLSQKTGFKIVKPEKPVIIRDEKGILFFSTEANTPRVTVFNLPAGKYWVETGHIRSLIEPINYGLMPLPRREYFDRQVPKNFKIIWARNPNKCTVDWDNKTITFDPSMKEWTKPELDFIKFHEFSHSDYETERFADLKSANYMILKGYNPSQIGIAQIDSLSPAQVGRKDFLSRMISKHYKNFL